MRKTIIRLGLLAASTAFSAALLASPAIAQTAIDPQVGKAMALVTAGRSAEAYAGLSPLTAKRAGNPDFDYALGMAAVDSGHLVEGIMALQRVLAVDPANGPARAELARAYALAGDVNTAKREFDTVVNDPTLPDPVRQRLNGVAGQLGKLQSGGGLDVSGFAELQAGYDSNINTATAQSQLVIPLFAGLGPAMLSGTSLETSDSFVQFNGGVSAVYGLTAQSRLFASALVTLRENIDDDTFDQQVATLTGGGAYTLANRDVVSASLQYQPFWIAGDFYRSSAGVVGQFTHGLSGGAALSLSAQYYRLDYDTDPLRDADRIGGTVSYANRMGIIAVQAGKEETRLAVSDNLSNRYAGISAASEYALGPKMVLVASAGFESRQHDLNDPLFLTRRRDQQYDASLGVKIDIGQGLIVRPAVTYTRNHSNIALYDYDRVTASVTLRKEF